MAQSNAEARCAWAMLALLFAVFLFSSGADARPLVSGWEVSLSTGSSDATLWRKLTTAGQTAGYHRVLLDLETSRKVQETVENESIEDSIPAADLSNMDYAHPRSNKPGSSDQMSPPVP